MGTSLDFLLKDLATQGSLANKRVVLAVRGGATNCQDNTFIC